MKKYIVENIMRNASQIKGTEPNSNISFNFVNGSIEANDTEEAIELAADFIADQIRLHDGMNAEIVRNGSEYSIIVTDEDGNMVSEHCNFTAEEDTATEADTVYTIIDREDDREQIMTDAQYSDIAAQSEGYYTDPIGYIGYRVDSAIYMDTEVVAIHIDGDWYLISEGESIFVDNELSSHAYDPEEC